jgi:hypothetical protein
MPDLIDQAVNLAIAADVGTAVGQIGSAVDAANSALGVAGDVADKLNNLPLDKDPETIQREIEAKIQQKKADAAEKLAKANEVSVEDAKNKLKNLTIASLPSIPTPIIDPKILATVSLLKQAKEVVKNRKKLVKENLEKGRQLYRYDMKPIKKPIPTSTDTPKLPTLPNVPDLPTL